MNRIAIYLIGGALVVIFAIIAFNLLYQSLSKVAETLRPNRKESVESVNY